jgi:hypothetical protein
MKKRVPEIRMHPKDKVFLCQCECHSGPSNPGRRELLKGLGLVTLGGLAGGNVVVAHAMQVCDCGKPVRCPPPHIPLQPGTVNITQSGPPLSVKTSSVPPWNSGKPPAGDPGQIPWFQGQIQNILKNGPTFGPRKDEFLPYLLIRGAAGDRGTRPIDPFWESPDIFVVPNQDAAMAPPLPATFGGVAQASAPNTLYAHVWNFGKAPVSRARVEFYWFNPSLGITQADANLIGATWVDLANRFTLFPSWVAINKPYGQWMTEGCHAIVRCPVSWTPQFQNNGHECLVVRVFEPILDAISPSQFSAGSDRHIGQRNIAVVQAHSPAAIDLTLNLGYPAASAQAEVQVKTDAPATMEWLKLYAGSRNPVFNASTSSVTAGFSTPSPVIGVPPHIFQPHIKFHQKCHPLKVGFHAETPDLKPNEAQILRLRHLADGKVVGGYTVVFVKT